MGICVQPCARQYLCLGRKYEIIIIDDDRKNREIIQTKPPRKLGGSLKIRQILQMGYLSACNREFYSEFTVILINRSTALHKQIC